MIYDYQPYEPFKRYRYWQSGGPEGYNTKPKVGETWYYKLPNAIALQRGWISDVTDHTVEIRTTEYSTCNTRYKIEDLEWVEHIKNPEPTKKPTPQSVSLKDYIDHVQKID